MKNKKQFGEFLNSFGYDLELDKDELWAEDWIGSEHTFKDILELFNDFSEFLNKKDTR